MTQWIWIKLRACGCKAFQFKIGSSGTRKIENPHMHSERRDKKKNALQVLTHTGGRGRESNFKIH